MMMSAQDGEEESRQQVGHLLAGSWELTQKIFENLSFCEVVRLRFVCKTWAAVGAKIIGQQRRLHYFTVHPHTVPTTEGKVALGRTSPDDLFEGFFENIVSKPKYCLAFCSEGWLDRRDVFKVSSHHHDPALYHYLHTSLPSSCNFGLISSMVGVVGTVERQHQGQDVEAVTDLNRAIKSFLNEEEKTASRGKDTAREGTTTRQRGFQDSQEEDVKEEKRRRSSRVGYSIEVEESGLGEAQTVSLLLIPHHPGVVLKIFSLDKEDVMKQLQLEDLGEDLESLSDEEFNQITSLTPDDRLKALLILENDMVQQFSEAFIKAALRRERQQLALGGGLANSLLTRQKGSSTLTGLGIAVCGPNVMAASVVIPRSVTRAAGVKDYMEQLKGCGLPEEQSVAFMFTCCGRGRAWYQRVAGPRVDCHNVETAAFRHYFPNTPIFGFFGGGEIGLTYLPKFAERDKEEVPAKMRKRKVCHQFSTIIVLLSFL